MSDPVFELPILSDPESLIQQDLEIIEEHIFRDDVPTPIRTARDKIGSDAIRMADVYSPAASLDRPLVSPELEIKRIRRDLKVEEPLTPTNAAEFPKTVRFDEIFMEWPIAARSPSLDPFESTFFEEAFSEAHEKAIRTSQQERLIAADTTARVDVPIMDFSPPIPPWLALGNNQSLNLVWNLQKIVAKDVMKYSLTKWPSSGKAKLLWNPFPRDLAKVVSEKEFVDDDSTWQAFIRGPRGNDVIDTSTLTWKPPGLRILKDEGEDDEIETAQFEKGAPQDLSYLIKKRKMEIEERNESDSMESQGRTASPTTKQPPRKKTPKLADFVLATKKRSDHSYEGRSLLMGGAFSVRDSVDNFLEIRGIKNPKIGESSHFAKTIAQLNATPLKTKSQPELLMQLPIRNTPAPKTNIALPAPPNNIANTTVNVIIASTLLKHRALIKHVESLAPKIVLVERDFSAYDTTIWMPGSVARSPIASPLASEADIIVSPLVGIVITTLQKIKQKPLPGQKTKVAIRERLEKLSARYEKLVVFVTEGGQDESTRELDDSDCAAFTEFVAFAITLPTTISVQYIGGGEGTLAKWVVSSISFHKADLELLADETHWELFLRRAGLNAFAAQAIISNIKTPYDVDLSSPGEAAHFGLTAFVEMGAEQRIASFGPVCGNRLMERVSAVIDARWS